MPEWNDNSIIADFRNLRAGQFEPMREALGIRMSEEQLSFCAIQCALVLRRDPTIGEIRLWDRLAGISASPAQATLVSLETESASIAETYADMMAKRRDLLPSSAPFSLADALSLATDTLERGGKDRALQSASLRLTDLIAAPAVAAGVAEEGSPAFLSVSAAKTGFSNPETGDVCLLIDRGGLSHYDYLEKLLPVLEDEELLVKLYGAFPVTAAGLLPALLNRFDSFSIDLARLGQPSIPSPQILAGEFSGDWILVLAKEAAKELAEQLRDIGINGFLFATLTNNKQISILGHSRLSENADFLRSLILPCPEVIATLQAGGPAASISHQTQSGYGCRFLPDFPDFSEASDVAGLQASSASASLFENAFTTSVLTALEPILSCALSGVDYSELRLAVDLALRRGDAATLPAAFAAAIGLYRVQAELGIPAAQTRISEQEIEAPKISVFAAGKGVKAPAGKLTEVDSRIYLIPIPLSAEGLTDFAALRTLLEDFTAQAHHNVIRAAHIVLQKTPKAALAEMWSNTLRTRAIIPEEKLNQPLALSVLLESIYEMPFEQIATVTIRRLSEKAIESSDEIPALFKIPEGNGLIPREVPEAVLYAPENCPDAIAVARFLRSLGACVKIFTENEKKLFLRAVLTASVVYRFPELSLPDDDAAKFAFSILQKNGGKIRCLKQFAKKGAKKPFQS